ncbi:hypothetical protein PMI34_01896 [Pseudomonas sp. GM74]|uniref:hypothetical protein n=1 Tax=Pseudomonas sp. GM74 TaxID=1144336 RepID=UPI0002707B94|nr:hypothetical protein [Pseudomonas sp. GM74]EJM93091.1 hypothetical protein PMI34_01896 [Pseudomonas sp. GM74]
MTPIQLCALISLIVAAALLYWTGYRIGLTDGRIAGVDEGTINQRANSAKTIHELEASLQLIRADHQHLDRHCKKLKDIQALNETHHQTLLEIAEKLRIAAETFSAFRTGKKLERDSLALRNQALAMAALIVPKTLNHLPELTTAGSTDTLMEAT